MTPAELLNERIRRDIRRKQRELADHVASRLASTNAKLAREHELAIGRKQKSIASLTAKLLCAHSVEQRTLRVNGFNKTSIRCPKCRAHGFTQEKA